MPPVQVDPKKVREFETAEAFYAWLRDNHDSADELWIKMHKVGSGLPSIVWKEAVDTALCWGWIDGIRKSLDDTSFLQRYTPRRPKSVWSKINVENVSRLIEAGVMTEHGLKHVESAKADGRWDRAYASVKQMELPADLLAAVEAEPSAKATLATLNSQNRYALALRLHNLKTEAARKRKVAEFVAMLARGETIYQQPSPK